MTEKPYFFRKVRCDVSPDVTLDISLSLLWGVQRHYKTRIFQKDVVYTIRPLYTRLLKSGRILCDSFVSNEILREIWRPVALSGEKSVNSIVRN